VVVVTFVVVMAVVAVVMATVSVVPISGEVVGMAVVGGAGAVKRINHYKLY